MHTPSRVAAPPSRQTFENHQASLKNKYNDEDYVSYCHPNATKWSLLKVVWCAFPSITVAGAVGLITTNATTSIPTMMISGAAAGIPVGYLALCIYNCSCYQLIDDDETLPSIRQAASNTKLISSTQPLLTPAQIV